VYPERLQVGIRPFALGDDEACVEALQLLRMVDLFVEATAAKSGRAQVKRTQAIASVVGVEPHAVPCAMQIGTIAQADELTWSVGELLASDHGADKHWPGAGAEINEKLLQRSFVLEIGGR